MACFWYPPVLKPSLLRSARLLLATTLLACAPILKAAEYNFVVEPSYSADKAREVYANLVAYLSKATGHDFKLVAPRNYFQHWNDMRRKTKDLHFVFDEPHFTDYRIQRFNYKPLAKVEGPLSYIMLSTGEEPDETTSSFVGRRVVTMSSPSLGYLLLLNLYENPLQQPTIISSAASWRDTVEIVFAGEGEAALVPNWMYNLYSNMVPVYTSQEFPGLTVSVAADVDPQVATAVRQALLAMHEDQALYEMLVELGIPRFVEADASEYRGMQELLKNSLGY